MQKSKAEYIYVLWDLYRFSEASYWVWKACHSRIRLYSHPDVRSRTCYIRGSLCLASNRVESQLLNNPSQTPSLCSTTFSHDPYISSSSSTLALQGSTACRTTGEAVHHSSYANGGLARINDFPYSHD